MKSLPFNTQSSMSSTSNNNLPFTSSWTTLGVLLLEAFSYGLLMSYPLVILVKSRYTYSASFNTTESVSALNIRFQDKKDWTMYFKFVVEYAVIHIILQFISYYDNLSLSYNTTTTTESSENGPMGPMETLLSFLNQLWGTVFKTNAGDTGASRPPVASLM